MRISEFTHAPAEDMATLGLDAFTRDVLWQVAHGGPYHSSVVIASDLADLGRYFPGELGDGWLLVEMALDRLNALDLVRFSLGEHGVFIRVRCTPAGYSRAGLPRAVRVVGARRPSGGTAPVHSGDPTDYRTQSRYAHGEAVERMPLREHILLYWDHAELHLEALWAFESREGTDR